MMDIQTTPQDYIEVLVKQRNDMADRLVNAEAANAALQRGILEMQEALAEVRAEMKALQPDSHEST